MLVAAPESNCGAVAGGVPLPAVADESVRATYSVAGVSSRELAKWDSRPLAFSAAETIH